MVTLGYMGILISLTFLSVLFDMSIFSFTFWESLKNLFYSEVATGRIIVLTGLSIGILTSMVIDYRIFKQKNADSSIEENGD